MADTTSVRYRRGRLEVARRVRVPPERAWRFLLDTHRWPEWGPSVRAVESPDRSIEAGTAGRIRTPVGWVPFEVTGCDHGARRWTWEVAGVPATGHRVDPAGPGCRVVFEVPLLGAAYVPVCRRALGRIAERVGDQASPERSS